MEDRVKTPLTPEQIRNGLALNKKLAAEAKKQKEAAKRVPEGSIWLEES